MTDSAESSSSVNRLRRTSGSDPRAQLVFAERFGKKVVGAGVDTFDALLGAIEAGHEHDRNEPRGLVVLDPPAHLETGELRHHDVGHHHVRRFRKRQPEGFGAVASGVNGVPVAPEDHRQQIPAHLGVVCHDDRSGGLHDLASAILPRPSETTSRSQRKYCVLLSIGRAGRNSTEVVGNPLPSARSC